MNDNQLIAKANEALDSDTAMSISFMREALAAYRRRVEKPLTTGLPKLPKRQKETLNYLIAFIDQNGYAPSVRDIAAALKVQSSSTAQGYVDGLEKKGYIKRIGPRAIEIIGAVHAND